MVALACASYAGQCSDRPLTCVEVVQLGGPEGGVGNGAPVIDSGGPCHKVHLGDEGAVHDQLGVAELERGVLGGNGGRRVTAVLGDEPARGTPGSPPS